MEGMIKLSILVPSVAERRSTFLPKSLDMLYGQLESLPTEKQSQVEIIYLIENKTMMLGDKRNLMVDMAKGKYIAFVDCDDRIEPHYIATLLEATESDADSIVFQVSVSLNGQAPKICYYSKDYPNDYNTADAYFRLPNHIPCIKREVSKKVSFPSLKRAEDAGYAKLLKPYLKSEYKIDKVLYHYDYNDMTTVAQEDIPQIRSKRMANSDIIVDVVFVSNASKVGTRMTQNAINTCIQGANGLRVNCIVIEERTGINYFNATTYNPDQPFNYNYYLNFGAVRGTAPWIMFCNNDLIFKNGWLHSLLNAEYPIVSPISVADFRQKGITENEKGWECGRNLSGWAFMMKRDIYNKIGGLDNDFDFWFADNSLIEQLKRLDLPPMLVPMSRVDHLGSQTFKTKNINERNDLMWAKLDLFNQKYNQNLFIDHPKFIEWKKLQ
jgi:glycosyltransferase involved in cell wall biosynthesis